MSKNVPVAHCIRVEVVILRDSRAHARNIFVVPGAKEFDLIHLLNLLKTPYLNMSWDLYATENTPRLLKLRKGPIPGK